MVPLLDELSRTDGDRARVRGHLLRLADAATRLGDLDVARDALTRAVDLDPDDAAPRQALADLLFAQRDWAAARQRIEALLDEREETLSPADCVELHHRAARCACELGDQAAAGHHAAIALALDPSHRPTLLLRVELDVSDPMSLVADRMALAYSAADDEKATHFAAIGDLYAERLGNPATAREMYREALAHRPGDHVLLTKSLGLVAGQGDWSYCLDLLQRLIETERDAAVRGRYRHVAAMILRDELARPADAAALLSQAIEDDPRLFAASDELEAQLRAGGEPDPLIAFYYRRLEQLRQDEGRDGERLRLWDRLGEQCVAQGRIEDAVCAFEVAHSLQPDDLQRRAVLAALYAAAGRPADAIAQHQVVLAGHKQRVESYDALRVLYQRTGQPHKAAACARARALLQPQGAVEASVLSMLPVRSLGAEDWQALSMLDVDPLLSALFAVAAPAFAAERSRRCPPLPAADAGRDAVSRPMATVLRRVLNLLGLPLPPLYVDRDQAAACRITLCASDGMLVPAMVIGRAGFDDTIDERALAFTLARRLSDLRADRIARLLCPRAGELARIIDLASVLGGDAANAHRHTAGWLRTSLHPIALDQLVDLGRRVRARGLDATSAALGWLEATERAADRIGLVVAGDLATCARALAQEPAAGSGRHDRIVELIWSSVTEEMFAVRQRVEAWPTR
jgi:tetratricopeptide (TPR) repeat protein